MERLKTVSLCMIVKNEENNLNRALQSVKNLVDEIVIVDTGSTDKTIEIAERFGAKIEYFKWNNNFSDARNYSLRFAKSEWILIMDADDEFDKNSKETFIEVVNTSGKEGHLFKTLSYAGTENFDNIICNLNVRLIRNNRGYIYRGKIHEQLASSNGKVPWSEFTIENVSIYHFGYLNSIIAEKNKRDRNIKLIEEELRDNPTNKFHMYNLGVEYYISGEIEKSYEVLNNLYRDLDKNVGYASKVVIQRVLCLDRLGRKEEALIAISEGLGLFKNFIDLEYIRGLIYKNIGRTTLAIDSFNRCISIGKPPPELEIIKGASDIKSLESLGEIYSEFKDYDRAIKAYESCIKINPKNYKYLYTICNLQQEVMMDNTKVIKSIEKYFNIGYEPNYKLLADIFMKGRMFKESLYYINKSLAYKYDQQVEFILGENLLYTKEYKRAYNIFNKIFSSEKYNLDCVRYMSLIRLLKRDTNLEEGNIKSELKLFDSEIEKLNINNIEYGEIYSEIFGLLLGENTLDYSLCNNKTLIDEILKIINIFIILEEKDICQKFIEAIKNIKGMCLKIATLYRDNKNKDEAAYWVMEEMKKFGEINKVGINILSKYI